jgi:hypothetical protein
MKEWRLRWERVWQPYFGYCLGQEGWLDGVAARKAHFRFWGIPVKFIKQWGRERRRSEKIVRDLEEQAG